METTQKTGKKRGPQPVGGLTRSLTVNFRCSRVYKDWLHRFARSKQVTPSEVIARGIFELARQDGFETPPLR